MGLFVDALLRLRAKYCVSRAVGSVVGSPAGSKYLLISITKPRYTNWMLDYSEVVLFGHRNHEPSSNHPREAATVGSGERGSSF